MNCRTFKTRRNSATHRRDITSSATLCEPYDGEAAGNITSTPAVLHHAFFEHDSSDHQSPVHSSQTYSRAMTSLHLSPARARGRAETDTENEHPPKNNGGCPLNHNYSTILVTTPEPTVLPPSRIAKRLPSSKATGEPISTSKRTLSPGMHISASPSSLAAPVTSVVRK